MAWRAATSLEGLESGAVKGVQVDGTPVALYRELVALKLDLKLEAKIVLKNGVRVKEIPA